MLLHQLRKEIKLKYFVVCNQASCWNWGTHKLLLVRLVIRCTSWYFFIVKKAKLVFNHSFEHYLIERIPQCFFFFNLLLNILQAPYVEFIFRAGASGELPLELLHEEFIINVPTLTYSHAFYLFLSTECLTEYCLNLFDYFSSIPSSFELALSSLSRNNY